MPLRGGERKSKTLKWDQKFQLAHIRSFHPFKAIMKMKSHGQLQPKLQNEVLCIIFFCCHARMLPFKCQRRQRRLFLASSHCQKGTALAEQKVIHITGGMSVAVF